MKVCILSMQRVANFGSVLQSYSLKKIIESLGHSVEFIDIVPSEEDNRLLAATIDDYTYERYSAKGLKKYFDKDLPIRLINKKKYARQVKMDEEFMNVFLKLDKKDSERYNTCVIGSDEVFNCMARSPWGFTSQLFGNIKNADRIITYAASCGSTTTERLPEMVKDKIISSFKNISSFSVRDENSKYFVDQLSGRECIVNYDPVFVGDFSEELNNTECPRISKPYCVIYSYQNRIHRYEEINALVEFCKKRDLKMITLLDPQKWSNTYYPVAPFEAIHLFRNAEFVFTDTFHGTILAAKYSRKYGTLKRDSNRNKLGDLIDKLEIQEHAMESISELDLKYELNDNKKRINQIYQQERKRTIEYLRSNL